MNFKRCNICNKIKPIDEFYKGNLKCKKCFAKINKQRRQKAREYISDFKKTHFCIVCGAKDNLQYHHLNPKLKKYCISEMVSKRCSINTVKNEIDKCVILCCSCHEKVHNENLDLKPFLQ